MYEATIEIEGIAPYCPGAVFKSPKLDKEGDDAYDKRCWRERITVEDGEAVIPRMAFKLALESASMLMGRKIKGKGNQTYSKHFTCGVLPLSACKLGVKAEDFSHEDLFVSSTGERGVSRTASKRVWKRFPILLQWGATVVLTIVDETITPDILREVAEDAGKYIGLGRFRPQSGGYNGRFKINKFVVKQQ